MYARDVKRDITLDGSPSFLLNNYTAVPNQLSVSYTIRFLFLLDLEIFFLQAFVRSNEVCIIKTNGDLKKLPIPKSKIHQVSGY